ncbi:MAG: hypothetical protein EYC70_13265 [Planctomycetota bacterium]|nr:MAG: hypothetical protein EYC70_13265 [Planctomycetota bacterium]
MLPGATRAGAATDPTTALHELEAADSRLTRTLDYADADPALLSTSGACSQLRDECLGEPQRAPGAAQVRSAGLTDLTTAAQLGSPKLRTISWRNQSLFHDRQTARQQAADLLSRALAAAPFGSELAEMLREEPKAP